MQRGWMRTEWTWSQAASPSVRREAVAKAPTLTMSRNKASPKATRLRDMVSLLTAQDLSRTRRPFRVSVKRQAHQTPARLSVAPEPFEAVRELRTLVALVRELSDEQRERLRVARDPQGSSVDRIEPYVADQLSGSLFAPRIIPR